MAENYEVLPWYRRFNQKHNTILRSEWDPALDRYGSRLARSIDTHIERDDPGYGRLDYALNTGCVAVVESLGTAINTPNSGLTSWTPLSEAYPRSFPVGEGRVDGGDPGELRDRVTRVARYLGADLVGFTELDERWVYSHHYLPDTGENPEVELPDGCDQVIVMGVELAFEPMATSPTAVMTAETSLNYSRMALLVASVAEFIRTLGYTAIPSINDTALNVPLAIDAGLAQPSRAGYAITERFGPRIRFCKVITDLPLAAFRKHLDLGVIEFCAVCRKCAEACPPGALPMGERTTEGSSTSNNPGVLKWYADYERCRKYWAALGTNCGICLRVCPFNQKKGFHHTVVRRLVRLKLGWLNRIFVWLHGVLGYGRRRNPALFWGREDGASDGSGADGVVLG